MKNKTILKPLAVSINDASLISNLSRKTLETAIEAEILKPIKTGKNGQVNILLVSDIETLLHLAQITNSKLNDDLENMIIVKEKIFKAAKKERKIQKTGTFHE